jgi:hypothetical protein
MGGDHHDVLVLGAAGSTCKKRSNTGSIGDTGRLHAAAVRSELLD